MSNSKVKFICRLAAFSVRAIKQPEAIDGLGFLGLMASGLIPLILLGVILK